MVPGEWSLEDVGGEELLHLLLTAFAAVAARGEAARADLGAENVFVQGDVVWAGAGVGVAGGGCGVEVHGVSHRRCGLRVKGERPVEGREMCYSRAERYPRVRTKTSL